MSFLCGVDFSSFTQAAQPSSVSPDGVDAMAYTKKKGYSNNDVDAVRTVEGTYECDYERDCTPLYKNIERENWSSVSSFLETGYWSGNFLSDPQPPIEQARTWVTRFGENGAEVRWSQLPLHLAVVVNAPYTIVGKLLEHYPHAVRCTDDRRMLPLHLAMRNCADTRVTDLLLTAFPESVNAKDMDGNTPGMCAINGKNQVFGRILKTFVERTGAKADKNVRKNYAKDIDTLSLRIAAKESEIGELNSKIENVTAAQAELEANLGAQVKQLEAEAGVTPQTSAAKMLAIDREYEYKELTMQKRILELQKEKGELESGHQDAKFKLIDLKKRLMIATHNAEILGAAKVTNKGYAQEIAVIEDQIAAKQEEINVAKDRMVTLLTMKSDLEQSDKKNSSKAAKMEKTIAKETASVQSKLKAFQTQMLLLEEERMKINLKLVHLRKLTMPDEEEVGR